MIDGYSELNSSISKTLDLINDVEMASKEQQVGIEQINDAVNELDQQTQKNVSVATRTKEIAIETKDIAHAIVNDANEKEFIGKDNVKAKQVVASAVIANTVVAPTVAQKNTNKTTKSSSIKQISSNVEKDGWTSF
jgi:methyl-accepting chemotaxis protein